MPGKGIKYALLLGFLVFWGIAGSGQGPTEVYLSRLQLANGSLKITALKNISENPGYDNQPSFIDDVLVLYARTREGQTDIARFSTEDESTTWLTQTTVGSEYSPLKIPGRDAFSAIRLDTTGLQRLYAYPMKGGTPKILLPGAKVGYHLWYDEEILVCTLLSGSGMDLVVANLKDETRYTFQKGVGRSLLRIPDSDRFSYVSVEVKAPVVKAMDPRSGANEVIAPLPEGVQDLCWFPDGTLVCGQGGKLLGYRPGRDTEWRILHDFGSEVSNITRLAINPSGTWLALVAETQPH